jgi:syntaxin-binding protein 5
VILDNKNDVTVYSLVTKQQVANYAPPGHVTAILTDASLDYCLTGLQNGKKCLDAGTLLVDTSR